MKTNKAFSLLEIMVALALLGMMTLGITRMMDNINVGLKSQKDVEMRTELFQVLNWINSSVDCNKTMVSAPPLPTSGGSPIALYRRGASTSPMVNNEGSNFGRFSVIANLLPSSEIQIQAASFKTPPSSSRDHLSDPESTFTKKRK